MEAVTTAPQAGQPIHQATQEATKAHITMEPIPFPLSVLGPYHAGKRHYAFEDASRGNRKVDITLWYPALLSEGSSNDPFIAGNNRDPDLSGAPYPLILSSTKMARQLAPYLVSHGFVWASVDRIDTYDRMGEEMFEQPLDILFALEQVASSVLEGLEGISDAEHAGVIGYSFDGYNTLAMSGARIDPDYYRAQCPEPDAMTRAVLSNVSSFNCDMAGEWDEFAAHVDQAITASEDGLWQPLTDERIRAVMPMAGEGWWLFGERGLAAADRPALMIVATQDELYQENAQIYEYLGMSDKALISFIGENHTMTGDNEMVARMAHFAVAFFSYHLLGRADLVWYFSEDFVAQFDDLAWGIYTEDK
jgi:hypothetical protein